jgi:hypothetical protein
VEGSRIKTAYGRKSKLMDSFGAYCIGFNRANGKQQQYYSGNCPQCSWFKRLERAGLLEKHAMNFFNHPARSKICADNAVCLRLIYIMVAINPTFSCRLF